MHIVILLVLVPSVSSHPCELWRCPMHLYFYSMRDKLIATMKCFLYVKQTNVLHCMLFMIFVCSLSCCMHSYYVLLLELHSFMHMYRVLWSQLSMLANGWIFIVRVHVTSKIILIITYLLEDEQELSLGMLIRWKRIYNFWCSMLVCYLLCFTFLHFEVLFTCFLVLTY